MCHDENLPGGCGLGGKCVEGTCVCSLGWTQSTEFSFVDRSSNSTSPLLCDLYKPLQATLYSLAVITLLIGAVAYGLSAKKWSQRRRLGSHFFMTFVSGTFCTLKLVDAEKSITDDVEQAVFFALATFLSLTSSIVLLMKYISLQYKANSLYNPELLKYFKLLNVAATISISLALLGVGFFISVPLIRDAKKAEAIAKLGFLLYSVGTLFGPTTAIVILNKLLKVLQKVTTEAEFILPSMVMRTVRNQVILCGAVVFFMFFPASFSSDWMRLEKYFVPIAVLTYAITSLAILFTSLKLRKIKKMKKQKVDPTYASTKQETDVYNI